MRLRWVWLAAVVGGAVCGGAVCGGAWAQDGGELVARLQRADALTRIDDKTLQPWYLKVSFQLYDSVSKPTEAGTLEEWFVSPGMNRRTITTPSYKATTLVNRDGRFRSAGSLPAPYLLEELERQVVRPMPRGREVALATPTLKAGGSAGLDCIVMAMPLKDLAEPAVGLFPSYCMEHEKDTLRAYFDLGTLVAVRQKEAEFQGRTTPVDLTFKISGELALTAHVEDLKTMPLTVADFPATGMESDEAEKVKVGWKEMVTTQIYRVQPRYPLGLPETVGREPVTMKAVIGVDGRIRSLKLVDATNAELATNALPAVLQWTFKPYKVEGKPVEVETTIPVYFMVAKGGRR